VAAAIHMYLEDSLPIATVLGNLEIASSQNVWKPFDARVCDYLAQLSRQIFSLPNIHELPGLVSLAYWIRPSAIHRLTQRHDDENYLIGRGMAFHIPPSNVPLNFAYSLFCGLLSGNSNVVRLSSTESIEATALVELMRILHGEESLHEVSARVCLIRYEHDDSITRALSIKSAARVIWGGNETVRRIRGIETAPRSVDIVFADRVSAALLQSSRVEELSSDGLLQLVDNFIADGYTFDQNACSSPRLVIWHGTINSVANASSLFWQQLEHRLQLRETISAAHHMLRFIELCEYLSQHDINGQLVSVVGGATRIELVEGDEWRDFSKLRFGTFTEVTISNVEEVGHLVSSEVQTLGYFGYKTDEMVHIVKRLSTDGIDRVVPIGQALNFDTLWDGYDLIRMLARTVVII
jgi:hypothetical protein